jgi:hypothetical protein
MTSVGFIAAGPCAWTGDQPIVAINVSAPTDLMGPRIMR